MNPFGLSKGGIFLGGGGTKRGAFSKIAMVKFNCSAKKYLGMYLLTVSAPNILAQSNSSLLN